MFEIISKNNNMYNVLDTEDGVIKAYSFLDIISYIQSGVDIQGVSFVNDEYVFEIDNLTVHRTIEGYKFRLYPKRDYERSKFCQKSGVADAFYELFKSLNTRYAVVSYNNEGLLSTDEMMDIIGSFGRVKLYEYPYRRYKSKIPNNKSGLKEQIYFVEMI